MPQPPAYTRLKDFTENFGSETDHSALNAELDAAGNSINDIRTNLAILQADDGKLRPSVVTPDSISPALRADLVNRVVVDSQQLLADAQAAANAAVAGATTATTKANEAGVSANTAGTKAGEATVSATTAGDAATTASTKRDEAVAARDAGVAAKDTAVGASNTATTKRDEAVGAANTAIANRDEAIAARDTAITKRDEAVAARDTAVNKATEASNSATNATNKAAEAAASAASTNLPASLVGKGLNFLRVNAGATGYEHRTAGQVASDLNSILGVDQTVQNVTASRALSTTYTNSTGRPILVTVSSHSDTTATASLLVDTIPIASASQSASLTANLSAVIPPGSTYGVLWNGGSVALDKWFELR